MGNKPSFRHRRERKEDNIIKDINNLFRLRSEIDNSSTKDIRNFSRLKKEKETTTNKITKGVKLLFEEEDNYYKPIKVGKFWSKNYIEYETNGDRNKNLSVKEYLN